MKLIRSGIHTLLVCLSLLVFGGCALEEAPDYRERDYGYVQFKLYKEASYDATKAIVEELDYLGNVTKVTVTLQYGESRISQTLVVSATSSEAAEYGLRSEKLKLLAGEYKIIKFTLFDKLDETVYESVPENTAFTVVESGLTSHDLCVNVTPRGKVRFTLTKDLLATKAPEREYTFDEIAEVDIEVKHKVTGLKTKFEELQAEYSIHFTEDNPDDFGYQTSSSICDTLLSLRAGAYEVSSYVLYDTNGKLLETRNNVSENEFEIVDNAITDADVPVTLLESAPHIQDYYALKAIWESLDGENWYYIGENYPTGANWDFNKDVDLWGDQPGVYLHTNGRVASLDISNFGFTGACSERLGDLTELVELYLGTHNDTHNVYDPLLDRGSKLSRMDRHKAYLSQLHMPTQMSEPIARALMENDIMIPEISMYEKYNEDQLIEKGTGKMLRPELKDMNFGKLTNGLTSLPASIGNLVNLETFYVANGLLKELPASMANLTALTDLELYNCPEMDKFPMVLAEMPELISILISNNKQWSSEEIYKGLDAIAKGPAREEIQMLYSNQNNLKAVPASFKNLVKLGLLDLANNQIEKFEEPLGQNVNIVQFYLDNNLLTDFPRDEQGLFCGTADVETFSVRFNKFKKFPNIFTAKSIYYMASVDFSYNEIDGFEGEEDGTYKGILVSTLTLNNNPKLTKYPKCLAETNSYVAYISLRGCSINEIPEGSFVYENAVSLVSMDFSYNDLDDFPKEMHAGNLPYLYGVDVSYNRFASFPWEPLDSFYLTVLAVRCQRDVNGERCLSEWPTGIYNHRGLRALYLGSNNLGKIDDTISYLIYYLDISDNPNIIFDASDICSSIYSGSYMLIYDQTQEIRNCDILFR